MKKCSIIGISDSREQWFPPRVMDIIHRGKVFSGGKRHHEIVQGLLPKCAEWIDITVPLKDVFEQYDRHEEIVVFASGDPLFYGFAATVLRKCPNCAIEVFPWFNSLQMLAHRMCLPYQDMHVVSLTGRPWDKLDEAVINGEVLIGCLTDRTKTPQAVWQRLAEYGYNNYRMIVGESLGNEMCERVSEYHGEKDCEHEVPNCVVLQRISTRKRPFGIPEGEFDLLNGRSRMITKMPIRLLSLGLLDLRHRHSFWDIGFCTGSVSIEAKLQFPHLNITAFEVREEGRKLIHDNSRRFGTPGINDVIGDFMELDISVFPQPDAVFIGGHGGRLREMVAKIHSVMNSDCNIVFNSVSDNSKIMFVEAVRAVGMKVVSETRIAVDEHNPIIIMKAQ